MSEWAGTSIHRELKLKLTIFRNWVFIYLWKDYLEMKRHSSMFFFLMLGGNKPALQLMSACPVPLVLLTFTRIVFNPGSVKHRLRNVLFSFTEVTLCPFFVQTYWKPHKDGHKSKSDLLRKETCLCYPWKGFELGVGLVKLWRDLFDKIGLLPMRWLLGIKEMDWPFTGSI